MPIWVAITVIITTLKRTQLDFSCLLGLKPVVSGFPLEVGSFPADPGYGL